LGRSSTPPSSRSVRTAPILSLLHLLSLLRGPHLPLSLTGNSEHDEGGPSSRERRRSTPRPSSGVAWEPGRTQRRGSREPIDQFLRLHGFAAVEPRTPTTTFPEETGISLAAGMASVLATSHRRERRWEYSSPSLYASRTHGGDGVPCEDSGGGSQNLPNRAASI
jgi:hypothetical protein